MHSWEISAPNGQSATRMLRDKIYALVRLSYTHDMTRCKKKQCDCLRCCMCALCINTYKEVCVLWAANAHKGVAHTHYKTLTINPLWFGAFQSCSDSSDCTDSMNSVPWQWNSSSTIRQQVGVGVKKLYGSRK
jgi:hypothetical protein